jgi:hypothetical protein
VDLLRERMELSAGEDAALRMFLSPPRSFESTGSPESVADAVAHAAKIAGLTEGEEAKLTAGLEALGTSAFTIIGTDPTIAVLLKVDILDPHPLLAVAADPDLSVALGLGLSTMPPGHWSIPGLVASAVYAARNRLPVGDQLLAAVESEANATASA